MGSKATVNIGTSYSIPGFVDAFTAKATGSLAFSKTVYVCEGNYSGSARLPMSTASGFRLSLWGFRKPIVSFDWARSQRLFNLVVESKARVPSTEEKG
jgi:hypothetical protein